MPNSTTTPQVAAGIVRHAASALGAGTCAASSDDLYQLLGAVVAVLSLCWSIWEKTRGKAAPPKCWPPPPAGAAMLGVLLSGLLLTGCTVTRMKTDNASVTSYTVAWPWTDTTKALEKASLTSATNKSSINLAGFAETERGNTNTLQALEGVIGAAVGAAVKAAK